VIFGACLLSVMLGTLLDVGVLPGAGFVTGCALAALATRKGDLLTLVVSPPLVFFVVSVTSEFAAAVGEESMLRSTFVGIVTTFAAQAPWLFLGTALVVVIALPRGLMTSLLAMRAPRPRPAGGDPAGDTDAPDGDTDDDPVRWDN
jgi:hypothetical protein